MTITTKGLGLAGLVFQAILVPMHARGEECARPLVYLAPSEGAEKAEPPVDELFCFQADGCDEPIPVWA